MMMMIIMTNIGRRGSCVCVLKVRVDDPEGFGVLPFIVVYHFGADGKTFHGSQGRDGWRWLLTMQRGEDQLCE